MLTPSRKNESLLIDRWEQALPYFRRRKAVIFLSYCRYWEKHGFVQQSLARYLTAAGVKVLWLDGAGWRPHRPVLPWRSPHLKVKQLFALPGRRFSQVNRLNYHVQKNQLEQWIQTYHRPLIWVQGGLEEGVAELLPYIDVYSTFDDPYREPPQGTVCKNAKLILCQNSTAYRIMESHHPQKTFLSLPPFEIRSGDFSKASPIEFPKNFPSKRMGYFGSFFSHDYDLDLFEQFVRRFPDFGFLLAGRTDKLGKKFLEKMHKVENFLYVPWRERAQLAPLWNAIQLTLLLYRPHPSQRGAFPVKFLESLAFGVPCVATRVPKTEDLEGTVFRSSLAPQLFQAVRNRELDQGRDLQSIFEQFVERMHPLGQLSLVGLRLDSLDEFGESYFEVKNLESVA